jgi:hypothetical protein
MPLKVRPLHFLLLFAVIVSSYIVKKGDTLWDLSESFLEDPFRWPEIWENNPHIENPHLIYPGDSLNVDGTPSDGFKKTPSPFIPDSLLPGNIRNTAYNGDRDADFRRRLGGLKNDDDQFVATEGKFISSDYNGPRELSRFLQMASPLLLPKDYNMEKMLDVSNPKRNPSLRIKLGDELMIHGGKSSTLLKADQIVPIYKHSEKLIYLPEKELDQKFDFFEMVGIARIEETGLRKSRARLETAFQAFDLEDCLASENLLSPLVKVKNYSKVDTVDFNTMPKILYVFKENQNTRPNTYAMLNKGELDGLKTGDAMGIWENKFEDDQLSPRLLGRGIVMQVNPEYSFVMIRDVIYADRTINSGALASVMFRAIQE